MHTLKTKHTLTRYIQSYRPPELLIRENHKAIVFSYTDNIYKWSVTYLMELSVRQLADLSLYLEEYYRIPA